MGCGFSANAEHLGVRGGVATGAESCSEGSLMSESVFPKSVHTSSTVVKRFDHHELILDVVEGHGAGSLMFSKIPSIRSVCSRVM